jgi:hypothetical protein
MGWIEVAIKHGGGRRKSLALVALGWSESQPTYSVESRLLLRRGCPVQHPFQSATGRQIGSTASNPCMISIVSPFGFISRTRAAAGLINGRDVRRAGQLRYRSEVVP